MTNYLTKKSVLLFATFLAGTLLLAVTGCSASRDASADASKQDPATDPIAQAHKRGREWAERNDAKLVTDCGALADGDERFGCADYVNHR